MLQRCTSHKYSFHTVRRSQESAGTIIPHFSSYMLIYLSNSDWFRGSPVHYSRLNNKTPPLKVQIRPKSLQFFFTVTLFSIFPEPKFAGLTFFWDPKRDPFLAVSPLTNRVFMGPKSQIFSARFARRISRIWKCGYIIYKKSHEFEKGGVLWGGDLLLTRL